MNEGAQLLTGGHVLPREGYYFEPTVLAQAPAASVLLREEIFGPVLCAEAFTGEAQAVELPTTRATHSPGACGRAMCRARTGWPRRWMPGFSG